MSHTPGPWRWDDIRIALLRPTSEMTADVVMRRDAYSGVGSDDAKLIAAAPELLKALRNLIDVTPGGRAREEGRALLAKLEGV